MSAIITLKQRDAVHILSDGAAYDSNGRLRAVLSKSFAIPHLSAVIATRGPAVTLPFIATRLSDKFSSFDELVSGIEPEFSKIVNDSDALFALSGATAMELAFIGWSEKDDACKAFTIQTSDEVSETRAEYAGVEQPAPYRLIERQNAFALPAPSADIMLAAGFRSDIDIERIVPDVDLFHIMEMQRQSLVDFNGQPTFVVGGLALLSTVARGGKITQRVIHRWPDAVGEMIDPEPITDWKAWRAARLQSIIPTGLSRLQRERYEKKAKKGTLRAA